MACQTLNTRCHFAINSEKYRKNTERFSFEEKEFIIYLLNRYDTIAKVLHSDRIGIARSLEFKSQWGAVQLDIKYDENGKKYRWYGCLARPNDTVYCFSHFQM